MKPRIERKEPIYGNLIIQNPDGAPMFRCGPKKFSWYLRRGLAEKIDEHTARLTFTPHGNGNFGDAYLMGEKHNICVVCGTEDAFTLTKHHIVPSCYRKHFPDEYKSHNHFDILPVCRDCHNRYEHDHADKLKILLAKQFSAPLDGETETVRLDEAKAVKYAKALRYNDTIPEERRVQMVDQIESYLGYRPKGEDMYELSKRKVTTTQLNDTHGRMVVEQLPDLRDFVMLWRTHFVEWMSPKHLPERWDINRGLTRVTVQTPETYQRNSSESSD